MTSKREAFFDDETFKAGLSKTLKKTMQDAVQSAMKDPSMLERLEPLGVQPIGSSSADLASTIKTQIAQYTQVAKEANIVIDQ